jgi:hypothetical protein
MPIHPRERRCRDRLRSGKQQRRDDCPNRHEGGREQQMTPWMVSPAIEPGQICRH